MNKVQTQDLFMPMKEQMALAEALINGPHLRRQTGRARIRADAREAAGRFVPKAMLRTSYFEMYKQLYRDLRRVAACRPKAAFFLRCSIRQVLYARFGDAED